jgi:glutamyl-tRNA synthetase
MRKRVRFAPSPTGPLHIGGVRTALYNYLFAKKHGGDFILRIEDTDSQRFVPGAEEYIVEAFNWLGITFDEGPHIGGKYGPYRQSERRAIYKQYVDQLLEDDLAYIAFDTPGQLEAKRNEIPNFQYDASTRMAMTNSLTLSKKETEDWIDAGKQYVVRIKIEPNQTIVVNDLIRGEVTVNSSILDDKVLYKSSDQLPTYHLANIVDDHLMEITQVIRGEEWLPSAPLHVILYRYLGWENEMPQFAHLPLLLKPEGNGKLSKRDGDRLGFPVFPLQWTDPKTGEISSGYREKGYLPDAVVNFLALLGWNPGDDREILPLNELIALFSLEKCSKSGAKFDYKKGEWFNHQYIQLKSDSVIAGLTRNLLLDVNSGLTVPQGIADQVRNDNNNDKLVKIVGLVKERVTYVKDIWEQASFFFMAPTTYDEKTVKKRWKEDSAVQLTELSQVLASVEDFTAKPTEEAVMSWMESKGYHLGNVMNAFRLALVGEAKGPHIFDITEILGKEETVLRLELAIAALEPQNPANIMQCKSNTELKTNFLRLLQEEAAHFTQSVSINNGDWVVKGFIDIAKNIYTISVDTKVISKIMELLIFPGICAFAEKNGFKIMLSKEQNFYPDITFIDTNGNKYAVDIKSTYRKNKKSVNGMTLGAFTGYFRDRKSTKNITFPYNEYIGHFVLGIIYTRSEDIVDERKIYQLNDLQNITSVAKDFEFFVQEKYKIANDRPGSGNTKNIGGVSNIERLKTGNGPFNELGEAIFDDYWMYYLTNEMAKSAELSNPFYSNLNQYKKIKKID